MAWQCRSPQEDWRCWLRCRRERRPGYLESTRNRAYDDTSPTLLARDSAENHRETSRNIPRVYKNIRRAIALYTSVWFILCTYLSGKEYWDISLYFPYYLKWFYTSKTCVWRIHKIDFIILLARFWRFMDKLILSTNIAKFTLGNVTIKWFT